jgi:hypothetical protein
VSTSNALPWPASPGAERVRRHRERQRNGHILFPLVLGSPAITALAELGWVADCDNRAAVITGFCAFVEAALDQRIAK